MTSYAHPELDDLKLPLTNGHLFKVLDENIPEEILYFLDTKFNEITENSFADRIFNHAKSVVSETVSRKKYKQWYLQKSPEHVEWIDNSWDIVDEYLKQWVEDIYHFKFSYTSPSTDISWHVLHPLPRIHIPLSDNICFCDIVDTSQKIHEVELKRGQLYLLNVCFPHRIRNPFNTERKQAFFSFHKLKPHV